MSLPAKWWANQRTIALTKEKLSSTISYKILCSFCLPTHFYIFHLAEEYKNSRSEPWNHLLTSAYDDLKPYFGNPCGLHMGALLKFIFHILQYVIYSQAMVCKS